MESDKIEAGLELDTLIASRVMGYICQHEWYEGAGGIRCSRCFIHRKLYSTDISAAWGIIDEVRKKTDRAFFLENVAGRWRTTFTFIPGGRLDCYGHADTAPLAICRAALMVTIVDRSVAIG